ncbi:MAG: hypothetical protein JWM76_2154 [Pseudonocardiales bacterium]|nr:hypothetical protein [Pseudonocardiales bacterium]
MTSTDANPPPLSIALGGGGAFGIGFNLGLLHAFADAGVAVSEAPMIGVSAGGWAAAAFACGLGIDEIAAAWEWESTHGDATGPVRVRSITDRLYADARDARVRTVTVRLPSCRRVVLDGAADGLSAAVAGSSTPPRLAQPEFAHGHRVYDGGVIFNTSADLAHPAKTLVAIAPMARGVLGLSGQVNEQRLRTETAVWSLRHRARVVTVRPNAAVIDAGAHWGTMVDPAVMRPTYDLAYRQGVDVAPRILARTGSPDSQKQAA